MHRIAALAGLLLLAGVAPALAESLATGCLSRSTGEIYGLRLYSNYTSSPCESGDEIVRFALHQPDTHFAKRRTTMPFGTHEVLARFDSEFKLTVDLRLDTSRLGEEEPSAVCELYLFYDEIVYMLASVAPDAEAHGLTSVEIFHQDDRKAGTTKTTTGGVHGVGSHGWAVQVHDLYVANRGGEECYGAFLIEFADDPTKLYSR
jgi:hypothetical protein